MDIGTLLEGELDQAVSRAASEACPPKLAEALRYAVFPGGARIRPRLVLAVANACGNRNPTAAVASAAAIELLHCASLVHDDLPCFDNSALRRGKPSVHAAYGERLAVLSGDALIVLAFEWLAVRAGERLAPLTRIIASCVGGPSGICAGQAWECEPQIDLSRYHRAKTGALFEAAAETGALSTTGAGHAAALATYGKNLGLAFQIIDDALDYGGTTSVIGKSVGDDFREGKITLPVIIARRRGSDEDRAFWDRALNPETQEACDLAHAVHLIRATGAAEATVQEAEAYAALAKGALRTLPASQYRDALEDLADFCVSRAY